MNVTIGQFAVSDCTFGVKTSSNANTYTSIADIEELNLTIGNEVQTWYSMTDDGWQNALLTGKSLSGSFSGKRTLSDTGNDFIEGLRFKKGKEAEADFQIGFPNGAKLNFTAVVALSDILGASNDVAPLSGELTGKGKPTFTPAS